MFINPSILLILFIFSSSCMANFHSLKNDTTPTLATINKPISNTPTTVPVANFSTQLQDRILQILAHQLIDDNNQVKQQNPKHTKTQYKTKTFSVSIDSLSTAFYRVSIKDNLQNKETLIKIPR